MKLSVAVADANAGASAFVVWRGFDASLRMAAQLGYHGVELALRSRTDFDQAQMRSLLKEYGLEVSCISTGQVFADLGLYLTTPDKAKRSEAMRVFTGLIEVASEFGGMVNFGRARGFVAEGQTRGQAENLFLDALEALLPLAERLGVTLIIEPVNRYELNFINTVDECAQLIGRLPSPNLGIMPDVFHMNIEDVHIGQALLDHIDRVKYVHLADSNRLAPGWGHLNFDEVFSALKEGGYDGWASIEILPKPDPDSAASQAARHILPMVNQYNQ